MKACISTGVWVLRVGVLASGRGSNLRALLEWQRAGKLEAEIVVVMCNHRGSAVLEIAREHGVPASVYTYPRSDASRRGCAQLQMMEELERRGIELVVLAGYDRVLVPEFLRRWSGRIINTHPSLLPAFAGTLHASREALAYGVKISGCSVHFVTEDVDAGPIIAQEAVPVLPDDDEASLASRILEREHKLLPEVVRAYARGRITLNGRHVTVKEGME